VFALTVLVIEPLVLVTPVPLAFHCHATGFDPELFGEFQFCGAPTVKPVDVNAAKSLPAVDVNSALALFVSSPLVTPRTESNSA
jgi:hypothetical protein